MTALEHLRCGTCGEVHAEGAYYNHNFVRRTDVFTSNGVTGPDGFTLDGLISNLECGHDVLFEDLPAVLRALRELRERRAAETECRRGIDKFSAGDRFTSLIPEAAKEAATKLRGAFLFRESREREDYWNAIADRLDELGAVKSGAEPRAHLPIRKEPQ